MPEQILSELYKAEMPGTANPDGQFPTSTIRRYEALLSSFNISTKAVTLLLLDEQPISPFSELYQRFRATYEGSEVDSFTFSTPASYCRRSLSLFGLTQEDGTGIFITPEGVEYGYPAAMKFLKFEKDIETSVYPILGRTATGGSFRPALSTAMVVMELSNLFKSQGEITENTDLPADSIRVAVNRLIRWGFAEKEGILHRTGETKINYQRTNKPLSSNLPRKGDLMEEVALASELLSKAGDDIDQTTVYELISDAIKKKYLESNLRSSVRHYLCELVEAGILERGHFRGGDGGALTQVRVLPLGEKLRQELLIPILDLVQDPTCWDDTDELAKDVMGHLAEYARLTGDLYFPFSQSAIKLYPNRLRNMLMAELTLKSGQSAGQLGRKLGQNEETIRVCLQRLMIKDNSPISRVQVRSVFYYHLGTN